MPAQKRSLPENANDDDTSQQQSHHHSHNHNHHAKQSRRDEEPEQDDREDGEPQDGGAGGGGGGAEEEEEEEEEDGDSRGSPSSSSEEKTEYSLLSISRSVPIASDSLLFVAAPCFPVAWLVHMLLCLISPFRGFLHEAMLRFRVSAVACVDLLMRPIQAGSLASWFCLI